MPRAPPVMPGLPLLGNWLDYRKDHIEVFWRGYKLFGPIFSIRLGPQRAVVLIGPEHQRFFFTQVDKTLSMPEVYKFVIPMFGRVLNAATDLTTRRSHLSLLHSAFQPDRMRAHVDVMANETAIWLDSLGADGTFEIFDAFAALGMNIAARAFMGREIRNKVSEFRPLYEDLARGMEFVLPPNLPLPRFRRRDAARKELTALLRPVIRDRLAHPGQFHDFLQVIVDSLGVQDEERSDAAVGLALMTVFTAYITTAAQTCWCLIQLLQHPDYLATVLDEQQRVLGDDSENITADTLGRLKRLELALKETQRMHPVMSHYARFNAEPYRLGSYDVPQGWLTMVCPAIAHRLPDVFSSPDSYDPARFGPERAEDRRHPYSLIGFGAGLYRCPGATFGLNEMKCILSMLLQRYTLELLVPTPQRDYEMGVVRPKPPCRVRYKRRVVARTVPSIGDVVPNLPLRNLQLRSEVSQP